MFAKKNLVMLIAALCVSTSVFAAEKSNEISVSGSTSSSDTKAGGTTTTNTNTMLMGAYGHYFTPQLVGQVAVLMMASGGSGSTTTVLAPGFGVKYYFSDSHKGDTVPFAGARLDLVTIDAPGYKADGTQVTGFVGASNFVSETASLDLTLSLAAGSVSASGGATADTTTTRLEIGFTQRF